MSDSDRSRLPAPAQIAVAAPTGLLHNSLITYLRAFPNLRIARDVTHLDGLFRHGKTSTFIQIILLDADLAGCDMPTTLSSLQIRYPAAVFIVLVDGSQQEQAAKSAGVRYVFLKGHLGDALKNALDEASVATT